MVDGTSIFSCFIRFKLFRCFIRFKLFRCFIHSVKLFRLVSFIRLSYSVWYRQFEIKRYTTSSRITAQRNVKSKRKKISNFFPCILWLELATLGQQPRTVMTNPPGTIHTRAVYFLGQSRLIHLEQFIPGLFTSVLLSFPFIIFFFALNPFFFF